MWHKKRILLPEEIKALLAVDAPNNDAVARDLWVDTGWSVSELVRSNVCDLSVSEDERVLDTVELRLRSVPTPPRRGRSSIPTWKTALLNPGVVERLVGLLETRRVATNDALLVDRGGRRYTPETFTEEMFHIAEQAHVFRLPEQ